MVNLLIAVLLSGLAVTFTIELLSLGLSFIISKEKLYALLSLPLSFGALLCFYDINIEFAVSVPAVSFIALLINKNINKPVAIAAPRRLPNL
jgi:hypothetical protein